MNPHILLVDDDPTALLLMKKYVSSMGYTCDQAGDGEEALRKLRSSKYHLLVTDLEMPNMRGDELIARAIKENDELISIIVSGVTDINKIISTLNQHKAYDFILKPVTPDILKDRIDKAFEVYLMRAKLKLVEKNENSYFQELMEIFDWKKELQSNKFESFAAKIIRQMNIGLFHGGGIGGLLTTLSLVLARAKKNPENKKYEITEKQYNLIKENYEISRDLVNGFTKAQAILMDTNNYQECIKASELAEIFEGYKQKLAPMLAIKSQRLSVSSLPRFANEKCLIFNKEVIDSAFIELLINAMKYSEAADTIYVIFFVKDNFLEVKILNPAYKNQDNTVGITGTHEMMIFEPFYRMSTVSHEGYYMEEFGAGIGLTVVKKIMQKHGADISIYTVQNYTGKSNEKDVSVTIRFPYTTQTKSEKKELEAAK